MSESSKVGNTATSALGSVEQFAAKQKIEVDKPKNPKVMKAPPTDSPNPMRFSTAQFRRRSGEDRGGSGYELSRTSRLSLIAVGVSGLLFGLLIIFVMSGGAMRDRYIEDLKAPLALIDDAAKDGPESDSSYQIAPPSETDPISEILPGDQRSEVAPQPEPTPSSQLEGASIDP